jgi:hypothetical protein
VGLPEGVLLVVELSVTVPLAVPLAEEVSVGLQEGVLLPVDL